MIHSTKEICSHAYSACRRVRAASAFEHEYRKLMILQNDVSISAMGPARSCPGLTSDRDTKQ